MFPIVPPITIGAKEAYLAAESAASLSAIPIWLDNHCNFIIFSFPVSEFLIRVCDIIFHLLLNGLLMAFRTEKLSVKIAVFFCF